MVVRRTLLLPLWVSPPSQLSQTEILQWNNSCGETSTNQTKPRLGQDDNDNFSSPLQNQLSAAHKLLQIHVNTAFWTQARILLTLIEGCIERARMTEETQQKVRLFKNKPRASNNQTLAAEALGLTTRKDMSSPLLSLSACKSPVPSLRGSCRRGWNNTTTEVNSNNNNNQQRR